MRTKETIEKEIEALQKEFESLPKVRWRAEENETYYCIDECFEVCHESDNRVIYDLKMWKSGNYFKTEAEAQKEARHREFEQKVTARFDELNGERLCPDSVNNFYYVHINTLEEVSAVCSTVNCGYQRGWIGKTKKITQKIIQEFGAENFLKYSRGEL